MEPIYITKQYKVKFFHPFLLTILENQPLQSAIIPILSNTNNSDINYIMAADNTSNIVDTNNFDIEKINSIYFSNKYFLLANFNITKIDDCYDILNNIITSNRNIKTFNFMINKIIDVFSNDIDDIQIDKLINIYILFQILL